jgi:hypothetical protein
MPERIARQDFPAVDSMPNRAIPQLRPRRSSAVTMEGHGLCADDLSHGLGALAGRGADRKARILFVFKYLTCVDATDPRIRRLSGAPRRSQHEVSVG